MCRCDRIGLPPAGEGEGPGRIPAADAKRQCEFRTDDGLASERAKDRQVRGGFVQIAMNKDKGEVKGQTSFAIVADAGSLYFGIRCK